MRRETETESWWEPQGGGRGEFGQAFGRARIVRSREALWGGGARSPLGNARTEGEECQDAKKDTRTRHEQFLGTSHFSHYSCSSN